MMGTNINEDEAKRFASAVMKKLKDTCEKWKKETGLGFVLYSIDSSKLSNYFVSIDRAKYGSIKDVTNKGYYTSNHLIDSKVKIDVLEKLKREEELDNIASTFTKHIIDISNINDEKKLEDIIKYAYDNTTYIAFERNEKDEGI